jgi:hypothetical protein
MEIEGTDYLLKDLEIECWENEHIFYVSFVALPSLIVWGFLLPLIALIFIYRNRHHFFDEDTRLKYAYLYLGFKPECYYWEFVI